MPTPTKGPRLGSGPAHQRLLLAGLATQLFEHRSITTTEAKAKRLRPYAERLVTFAKKGDLASRRQVMKVVRDKSVVHELFTEIGPAVANRPGGYTRITRIGNRKGDNAPLAVIELVLDPVSATTREAEAATARAARGRSTGAPVAAPAAAAAGTGTDGSTAEDTTAEDTTAPADGTTADGTTAPAAAADGAPEVPAAEAVVAGEVVEPDVEAPGPADTAAAGTGGTAADPAPVVDAGDATVAPDEVDGGTGDGGTEDAGDQRA